MQIRLHLSRVAVSRWRHLRAASAYEAKTKMGGPGWSQGDSNPLDAALYARDVRAAQSLRHATRLQLGEVRLGSPPGSAAPWHPEVTSTDTTDGRRFARSIRAGRGTV